MLGSGDFPSYAQLMAEGTTHLEVVIDVEDPIELGDFVTAFTSVGRQYRRYMAQAHPDLKDDATIFVREVRPGSIIAELLPLAASLIGLMDQALIVEQFTRIYGGRLSAYFRQGGRLEDTSRTELTEFMGQVAAVARSKNGKGEIRAVYCEGGKRDVRAAVTFNARQAATATREIEKHQRELTSEGRADHNRVLMTFKRSDIGDADVGVRSGEQVIIEDISEKPLPLIYGATLAEERIKSQMRNTDENIYHKGFVADVNVTTKGGRAVAYTVTHVHQIIDLPDN